MQQVQIYNRTRPLPESLWAGYCQSFWCRLRGLSFRRALPRQQSLLLVQAAESRWDAAIHMFFMSFDLSIIWLDDDKKVVDRRKARRWRAVIVPQAPARYVLEAPTFWYEYFFIGDQLEFEDAFVA